MKKLLILFISIVCSNILQAKSYTVYFDVDQNDAVSFISNSGTTYSRNTVTLKIGDKLKIAHQNIKQVKAVLQIDHGVLKKEKDLVFKAVNSGNAILRVSGIITKRHSNTQKQDISVHGNLRVKVIE